MVWFGLGFKPCTPSDGEREKRGTNQQKYPSFFLQISILPINFAGNYKIIPDVVFVLIFLCSVIIFLLGSLTFFSFNQWKNIIM